MVRTQGSSVAMSTNWSKCFLCKTESSESLVCPGESKRKDIGAGYVSMATNLSNFASIGALSTELAELVKQTGDLDELLTSKHA